MTSLRRLRALPGSLLLAVSLASVPAFATDDPPAGHAVAFGGGWFDLNRQQDQAAEGRLEVRAGTAALRPFAVATATTDASVFLGAGLGVQVPLGDRLVFTPSFAPGFYDRGRGKDLGSALEFRSQLEVAYRLSGGSRIGVSVSHLSNAGLGERNPGQESFAVVYELPLR